jgi:hypothetical protein
MMIYRDHLRIPLKRKYRPRRKRKRKRRELPNSNSPSRSHYLCRSPSLLPDQMDEPYQLGRAQGLLQGPGPLSSSRHNT